MSDCVYLLQYANRTIKCHRVLKTSVESIFPVTSTFHHSRQHAARVQCQYNVVENVFCHVIYIFNKNGVLAECPVLGLH